MKAMFNLLVLIGILFTTSCQPAKTSTEKAPAPTSTSNIQPPENNEGVDMTDLIGNPQAKIMIQLAKESLARKFKISGDQIHLASIQAITWPDSSLGCPQTGFVYEQVLTPGFQMLFEAGGQSYSYHTDAASRVILCRIHPVDEIFLTP